MRYEIVDSVPWPEAIPFLGKRVLGEYAPCAGCLVLGGPEVVWQDTTTDGEAVEVRYTKIPWTWCRYGGHPLCKTCALGRPM